MFLRGQERDSLGAVTGTNVVSTSRKLDSRQRLRTRTRSRLNRPTSHRSSLLTWTTLCKDLCVGGALSRSKMGWSSRVERWISDQFSACHPLLGLEYWATHSHLARLCSAPVLETIASSCWMPVVDQKGPGIIHRVADRHFGPAPFAGFPPRQPSKNATRKQLVVVVPWRGGWS